MDWSIFPTWMGIDSFGTLIASIILFVMLGIVYVIFGWACVPKFIKNDWIAACIILTWPVCYLIVFLCLPIILFVYIMHKRKNNEDFF